MKRILQLSLLVVTVLVAWVIWQIHNTGQQDPPGLQAGELPPCGSRPNCVSSNADTGTDHYIEPIDSPGATTASVTQAIEAIGGTIHSSDDHAITATFTSDLMGFVDDLIVIVKADGGEPLQVRSSSRMGYSDGGVNRQRVESLRQEITR